jgi:hypothetical protein
MCFIYKDSKKARDNRGMRMNKLYKIFFLFLLLVFFKGNAHPTVTGEYGGGPIVFIKPVRAVIFEHKFHLRKKLIGVISVFRGISTWKNMNCA